MAALSPEALDLLEFALGPKAKRGRGDKNDHRAGKAVARFGVGLLATPAVATFSVFGRGSHSSRSANAVSTLKRIVNRSPEVMVKVTGRQHGGSHVAANFAYISRLGYGDDKELQLLTSEGEQLTDWKQMKALANEWQDWELSDRARRKGATSLSLVLSMPERTDPSLVYAAVKEFAETEMGDRRWVMALHNDTGSPHVHLTVARRDLDGRRFHPDKEDLFRYRQVFAEKLRSQGVEANATPRKARGIVHKAERVGVYHIRKRGKMPQVEQRRVQEITQAINVGEKSSKKDPDIVAARRQVLEAYQRGVGELSASSDEMDRKLALEVAKFCQSMPAPISRDTKIMKDALERLGDRQIERGASQAPLDDVIKPPTPKI